MMDKAAGLQNKLNESLKIEEKNRNSVALYTVNNILAINIRGA